MSLWTSLFGGSLRGPQPKRAASQPVFIHVAAKNGDVQTVNILLKKDRSLITKRDDQRMTPLHVAAWNNRIDVAKILLANGADVNAKIWHENGGAIQSHDDCTPLHLAALSSMSSQERLAALRSMSSQQSLAALTSQNMSLQRDWEKTNLALAQLLLANGANIHANGDQGTPLHRAVAAEKAPMVKFLLANGANVNARTEGFGTTPLHEAVYGSHASMVELLLAKGANVNAKAELQFGFGSSDRPKYIPSHKARDCTPLHIAMLYNDRFNLEVIKLLLANGADVNAKESNGFTPLAWLYRHPDNTRAICDVLDALGRRDLAAALRKRYQL